MTTLDLKTIKEYAEKLPLSLKIKKQDLVEYCRVVSRYYSSQAFLKVDAALVLSYLFKHPFALSKRFLLEQGAKDLYTYGETPLTTLDMIARECRLSPRDLVFDLGCGRGRACFWLNAFIGCNVVGVEQVPAFIERANKLKERFNISGVSFRHEDILQTNLKGATAVYLYGTCFEPPFIEALTRRLTTQLAKGAKVITVSYALTEYVPDAPFEVLKRFQASFPWGSADIFLQVKKS